jgi:hypothetical protein
VRAHRVLGHVGAGRLEVSLVPDDPRSEAALEHVPAAAVTLVEELRVAAVQPLHARGEVLCRRLEDEVVVRVHQAVPVDDPAELARHHAQQVQEVEAVDVDTEDRCVTDAVGRDVKDPVREISAQQPCHLVFDGSAGDAEDSPACAFRHRIVTLR